MSPVTESDARAVLDRFQASASRVREVLGSFPEPAANRGRKVAVFLPADQTSFDRLGLEWGTPPGVVGFCALVWDGELRPYEAGIFLNPEYIRSSDHLASVATHELTHYGFEMVLDVRTRAAVASWFSEGLAEYAAESVDRLDEIPERLSPDQSLARRSPPDGDWRWRRDDYWMGLSALLTVESSSGKSLVRAIISEARTQSTDRAFARSGLPIPLLDQQWREALPGLRASRRGGA